MKRSTRATPAGVPKSSWWARLFGRTDQPTRDKPKPPIEFEVGEPHDWKVATTHRSRHYAVKHGVESATMIEELIGYECSKCGEQAKWSDVVTGKRERGCKGGTHEQAS